MITLTDAAEKKVRDLMDRSVEQDGVALRIAVQPGGCSGLRYSLYFDDQIAETDERAHFGNVTVVTDKMSAPYLKGVEIDYHDSLEKAGFEIRNPNAQSTCACGDSFH